MSVEVVCTTKPMGNSKGKEAIRTAYMSKYNINVSRLISSSNMVEENIN